MNGNNRMPLKIAQHAALGFVLFLLVVAFQSKAGNEEWQTITPGEKTQCSDEALSVP